MWHPRPALNVCSENGWLETAGPIFLFSVCGYLGVNVVLELVQTFGALTTVTVTTLRKAVSMIVSFVFFPKPFSMGYIWGGVIILGGTTRSTSVNRGVPQTYPLFFYIMFSFFLSLMRSAKHSFLSPVFSFCSFVLFSSRVHLSLFPFRQPTPHVHVLLLLWRPRQSHRCPHAVNALLLTCPDHRGALPRPAVKRCC